MDLGSLAAWAVNPFMAAQGTVIKNSSQPGATPNPGVFPNFDPSQIPEYGSATGPDGNLLPQYQVQGGAPIQFSSDIASSPWMKMLLGQNQMQTDQNVDALNSSNNSQRAMGLSSLATHGGATQGAMTNLANSSARNATAGQQGARAQGAWNAMNLQNQGVQEQANLDTQNRQYQTGIDQVNAATKLANLQGQNQYNLGKYNTQAQAWGANQTANAMQKGKK